MEKNSKGKSNTSSRSRFDSFNTINEKPVDDISLEAFYTPHSISALAISIAIVIYFAFVRDTENVENNIWAGMLCCIFFFLIISVLAFPNGPFTRPHPAVWRVVFGMSVIYLMGCLFFLFQNYQTVKNILLWFDPSLKDFHIDMDKEYGVNCSDITPERIWGHIDVFALGHYLGWLFKAILIRHMGILWAISFMWEITEIAFAHLLPNFIECWWDALILDVLICNGFGIWCGLKICEKLEMREYKWVSIRDIHTTSGKIKRAMLQFTPESWTSVRWLDPKCSYMRVFALCQLVLFWQTSELNTFFLKHVFELPASHPLVSARLILIGVIVAPSVRQYYSYVTDTTCKRVGTQCWVYGCIMVSEALICIKHGRELFERTQAINIIVWLMVQLVISVACVIGCVMWHRAGLARGNSRDLSPVKSVAGAKILFENSEEKED
ncbi:phosphatidylserine synthase [Tribolium castaneum]|uniref:Phosphatidylserine synthase n=1 Tax=Tribolium castaneum TaxID=7070 RepID=D6WMR8_TRICA|nr:PREDICTED: phosphatidylserine synthase 1 [Tribolium castaneum]EFA04520.1 Phosphatidylserine synthase 1-like Protein [Tribolium castaneum]|eukprot:XP_969370.1 PREDICTED: phosphatidylserine synthase 1 [Tribolium castaneum]